MNRSIVSGPSKRAVLYLRLSEADEASTSLERQEDDLRRLCDRRGWRIVSVLIDSGLTGTKRRQKADEALSMLEHGSADVLCVWKLDRFSRMGLGSIAEVLRVLDERPGALFVADQDGLSSDQPAFRLVAGVLSEMARSESQNTSLRVKSSITALKRAGRWSGGVVPWGYKAVDLTVGRGLAVDQAEATVIREAAARVIKGETVYAIMRDLNATGVATRNGAGWSPRSLAKILCSDVILGRVVHRGSVLRGDDGLPLAVWEPIVSIEASNRLRMILLPDRLPGTTRRRSENAHLLSGIVRCGECGAVLYPKIGRTTSYDCQARSAGKDCSGLSVSAKWLEEFITDEFLRLYSRIEMIELLPSSDNDLELAEIEKALSDTAAEMILADDISALASRMAVLKARRTELNSAPREIVATATGRLYDDVWDDSLTIRRRILAANVESLTVKRGIRGKKGPIDPARVDLVWRPVVVREINPSDDPARASVSMKQFDSALAALARK